MDMSGKMTNITKNKPKHTGGSCSFDRHSLKRKKAGALTPGMETYADVYNKHGDSDTVQKVREEIELQKLRAAEAIAEGGTFEVPSHVEAEILQPVMGTTKKRGRIVPGMGAEYKRPPKPRGGARTAGNAMSQEQIDDVIAVKTAEMEERAQKREEELAAKAAAAAEEARKAAEETKKMQEELSALKHRVATDRVDMHAQIKAKVDARLKAEVDASFQQMITRFVQHLPPHLQMPGSLESLFLAPTPVPTLAPIPTPAPADQQQPKKKIKKTKTLNSLP